MNKREFNLGLENVLKRRLVGTLIVAIDDMG